MKEGPQWLFVACLAISFIAGERSVASRAAAEASPQLGRTPLPKTPISCAASPEPSPGAYRLPADQTITPDPAIPGSDLILAYDGNIDIDGRIEFPKSPPLGSAPQNIILKSVHGKITINGFVGGGWAASSAGENKTGQGASHARVSAASNGGYILLIAPVINVAGQIAGNGGGVAGMVISHSTLGWAAANGTAVGGDGGFGGDVVLCALNSINVSPGARRIVAGDGGNGSPADTDATQGAEGTAEGGNGQTGGDVRFEALGTSSPLRITLGGDVMAGSGGSGGTSSARSGDFTAKDAKATGGNGGSGGTVQFVGKIVAVLRGGRAIAGNGGQGQSAFAAGGRGASWQFFGNIVNPPGNGGRAFARGGNGGAAGLTPSIPTSSGVQSGLEGTIGSGGSARISPGASGKLTGGILSRPGTGIAIGGANGAGQRATPVHSTGETVTSPGQP